MPVASVFLGATLVASAIGKLTTREPLAPYLAQFGVPRRFAIRLGFLISLVELTLGVLLLVGSVEHWVTVATATIALSFVVVHIVGLLGKHQASCSCFGAIDTDLTPIVSSLRAATLMAVALSFAFYSWNYEHNIPLLGGGAYALASGLMAMGAYMLSFPLVDEALRIVRRDRHDRATLVEIRKYYQTHHSL